MKEDNRHNCILLRGCFLPLQAAFQLNSSSFTRNWTQRSFKGTRVCYNFSGRLLWNLLASQLKKLCLWQFFTFSWFHLVPKIISLRSYSLTGISNSAETFVWIRLRPLEWDFKLHFKYSTFCDFTFHKLSSHVKFANIGASQIEMDLFAS